MVRVSMTRIVGCAVKLAFLRACIAQATTSFSISRCGQGGKTYDTNRPSRTQPPLLLPASHRTYHKYRFAHLKPSLRKAMRAYQGGETSSSPSLQEIGLSF